MQTNNQKRASAIDRKEADIASWQGWIAASIATITDPNILNKRIAESTRIIETHKRDIANTRRNIAENRR